MTVKYEHLVEQQIENRVRYTPDISKCRTQMMANLSHCKFWNLIAVNEFSVRYLYDNKEIVKENIENWIKPLELGLEPYSYDLIVKPYFPGSALYPWWKNLTFDGSVTVSSLKIIALLFCSLVFLLQLVITSFLQC